MRDINLISLKRTLVIALLLGFITLSLISQAVENTRNEKEGDLSTTSFSSGTSTTDQFTSISETISETQNTSTSTSNESVSQSTFNSTEKSEVIPALTIGVTETEANDYQEMRIEADKGALSPNIGGSIVFKFSLIRGILFVLLTSLFFILIALNYILVINSRDIREYLNRSLRLAGFQPVVNLFGKSWRIADHLSMNITGTRNIKVRFTLPIIGDPLEYGFRIQGNNVVTSCTLELLPNKLQLIRLYLIGY